MTHEDEPTRAVSVRYDAGRQRVVECTRANDAGCVRFELPDINALGSELYYDAAAAGAGERCRTDSKDLKVDATGRYLDSRCRDGNPATLHLVATNMLGRLQRPFTVDSSPDLAVWNYPAYRFELSENREVDRLEALSLLGTSTQTPGWPFNPDAKRFVFVAMDLWLASDAIPPQTVPTLNMLDEFSYVERYRYILELDGRGKIIGGEWVGPSKSHHPDFYWYALGPSRKRASDDDVHDDDNPRIRYSIFKQILTLAQMPAPDLTAEPIHAGAAPNASIPDNDSRGVASTISVSDDAVVSRALVRVEIAHPYQGDLRVVLKHAGREEVLFDRAGGSVDDLTLNVEAKSFSGVEARGDWTLLVSDVARDDAGTLVKWSLELARKSSTTVNTNGITREFYVEPNLAIPDDDARTGIASEIVVDEDLRIATLKVVVAIKHPYAEDLIVTLEKDGVRETLQEREGGSADDIRRVFEARAFVNGNARGTFTLKVLDGAPDDVGRLERWGLVISDRN